ncbi:MAG: hypothetical protein ACFNP4_10095, partial [Capnocytophaga gingivalis]
LYCLHINNRRQFFYVQAFIVIRNLLVRFNIVDAKLPQIRESIHNACLKDGQEEGYINYVKGANIAGFMKVAHAMLDQGVI